MTATTKPHRRFDPVFWLAAVCLLAGTVSCFGYAGMQLAPDGRPSRQGADASPKLRSPVSFERTR
ncbi:MAG: hypothetical protein KF850_15790 [Labilithrix sp.]|nr:hypothetical protein [Labilithrix sp.]MBX3213500.1 hypothetical protein [Labilithrix sp.]